MKVTTQKPAKSTRPSNNAVEEAEEVLTVDEVQDAPASASADATSGPDLTLTPENTEMVRFALTQDIEPAPRIGRFDLLHFTGESVLKKGIKLLPKDVAIVLKDRGYGDIIN